MNDQQLYQSRFALLEMEEAIEKGTHELKHQQYQLNTLHKESILSRKSERKLQNAFQHLLELHTDLAAISEQDIHYLSKRIDRIETLLNLSPLKR